ncbi:MAG: oligosaccharide flippase family protein [Bacteroidales bacterium]|nr:oligosaccharide flippase family protein [Bacteroidales bacterium]
MTRFLGPEGKGIYAVFFNNNVLFTLLFSFNVNLAIIYFISKKKILKEKILNVALYIFLFSFLGFILFLTSIYLIIPDNVFFPNGYDTLQYYGFAIVYFSLTLINSIYSSIFQAFKMFKYVNGLSITNSSISMIVFLILFLISPKLNSDIKIEFVLLSLLSIILLISIIWTVLYIVHIRILPKFSLDRKLLKIVFSFVIIGYLSNLLNSFNYRLDIWVVEYYTGLRELGLYSLAVNFSQMLWMISTPIVMVLHPFINSSSKDAQQKYIGLYSRLNTSVIIIIGVILLVLSDVLIPLIYGNEFAGSINSFKILIFGAIVGGVTKVFAVIMVINNKLKYNLISTAVGLAFTLVLDFVLIPKFGILGASFATTVSYISIFVVIFYFTIKKLKLPFKNYFIFKLNDFKELLSNE